MQKDKIYNNKIVKAGSFEFNDEVTDVFPDMLQRSIPGYKTTLKAIEYLARKFSQENTLCYDLGCSLGASSLSLMKGIDKKGCKIIAIDQSKAMTNKFKENIKTKKLSTPIEIINENITNTKIENASIVVMNYTLQFIPKNERQGIIDKIYNGLLEGGLFFISEKTKSDNQEFNEITDKLHHNFKIENSYSEMEIENKKTSLENILIRDDIQTHKERLDKSGFLEHEILLKYFNFSSFIAIK